VQEFIPPVITAIASLQKNHFIPSWKSCCRVL
jgi:hypothetical protein